MSQAFRPQSYSDWLNELNFSSNETQMINAATNAGRLALDKNAARHDIALILARKWKAEMDKNGINGMIARNIDERYERVAQALFNSKFQSLVNYIIKNEPEFDIRSTNEQVGKTPLGFVKSVVTKDQKGNARLPLGFTKRPEARYDEAGNPEPGLGFLADD